MTGLEDMSAKELIQLHNERCAKSDRLSSWKGKKSELINRVRLLGERPKQTSKPKAAEKAKRAPDGSISASVRKLLTDPSLSYDDIVQMVRAAHPDAETTNRSIASVASVMRKSGTKVPMRKGAN